MRRLYYVLWQDDLDPALVEAVSAGAGGAEVQLRGNWMDLGKDGGDATLDLPAPAGVAVEWTAPAPGAAMELCVWGPALADDLTEAQFGRRLARALRRPLLFSDCHLFPLTYMMAREDGAIVHVVVRDDDGMALLPDDPADPDYWERDVLFEPDALLPTATAAELEARPDPPDHCIVFGGRCPKRKFPCVSVRR
jgi:hypothetical protein